MKKYFIITLFLFFSGYINAKWNDGLGDLAAQGAGGLIGVVVTGIVTKNPIATAAGAYSGQAAGQTAWNYTYDNWVPDNWKYITDYFKNK